MTSLPRKTSGPGTGNYPRKSPEQRFWPHVIKTDSCWEWSGALTAAGYGLFSGPDKKLTFAHRFSWAIHKAPIPSGMHVLHRCDNPRCVNPDHLFLGNHALNMKDAASKDRNKHKISNDDTAAIKQEYKNGKVSQQDLATEYGISQAAIWWILHH